MSGWAHYEEEFPLLHPFYLKQYPSIYSLFTCRQTYFFLSLDFFQQSIYLSFVLYQMHSFTHSYISHHHQLASYSHTLPVEYRQSKIRHENECVKNKNIVIMTGTQKILGLERVKAREQ
jgi:hypothetical protein